jgi:rhodanese-related sulfurtransferase
MSPIKQVSTHDMTMLINRSNGIVVDTRAAADFNKGHITDAINLPLAKITGNEFGKLEKHKSDPIVVVCNAGISAKTAARVLHKAGFEQVSVLQGGMQTWNGANLPVVKG